MLKLIKDNPYPNAHKAHKIDGGCFTCGVYLGCETGKETQLEADRKAILDKILVTNKAFGHKSYECYFTEEEYQQLKGAE